MSWRVARREAAYECPACGVVSQSPSLSCGCDVGASLASLPYQVGGKFTVQRRIGAGAMGVVYLARDTTLGRDVALKTLPRLGISGVRRLRDEARAMAALNHAALATLYGLEVWRQTPVLVVEYFARGTLAHRLALGPLAADAAIQLGRALAAALSSMPTSGVLHRDLKPRNIALTSTGAPKLLDFGLATWVDRASHDLRPHGHAGFDMLAGTPAYLPPEAHAGAAGAVAFDLWALAVVILEATTGGHPFLADDRATTARRVVALELGDALSSVRAAHPGLAACLERALSRRPELRFQTADDMQAP